MAKRNRSTLKHFFQKGALPTANQFEDLIDSNLNLLDEGFNKSPEHGLEISSLGNQNQLISFFRPTDPKQPVWSISYDAEQSKLLIQTGDQRAILSVDPAGKVGVNTDHPRHALDVGGVLASQGRVGSYGQGYVPANGQWHRITDALSGCHAFEVMAGVGKKGSGMYALMHAMAMNTFNPKGWWFNFFNMKKRIRYQQAYYRSLSNKLKLRWTGEERKYYLELKSNSDYGDGVRIQYSMTNLWFDEDMRGSWGAEHTEPEGTG